MLGLSMLSTTKTQTSVLPIRRAKLFGPGNPRPMSRHQKVNLMRQARRLKLADREPGDHYGAIHAKDVDVLEALLFTFHNAKTGLCFPGYEAIAKAARCARSTVYAAIRRLEDAGLMTWVNRIKRVYERVKDMFGDGVHGQRTWVERTSNGYQFTVLDTGETPKSENSPGTTGQESFPLAAPSPEAQAALDRAEKSRKWH